MAGAIALRTDYTAEALRRLASRARDVHGALCLWLWCGMVSAEGARHGSVAWTAAGCVTV